MMIGTVYGLIHKKEVYPIDWWPEGNPRALREELMKKPEYIQKKRTADSLETENKIIQNFDKKYGNIWENPKKYSYTFWNGEEFNNYINESYKISIQVFGDSPINLYYLTRNQNMLNRINKAIEENKGGKFLILMGVEHKHFFDNALSKQQDISLIKFEDILPLKKTEISTEIVELIKTGNSKIYYDFSTDEGTNGYYSSLISALLHGPNMDFNPEIIPEKNIKKAKVILDDWEKAKSKSILLQFELGWYNFLIGSYPKAIEHYKTVINNIDNIKLNADFIKSSVYRNIGWCYDLTGKREKAIECYKKGETLIEKTKFGKMKQMIYKNYKTIPYKKREKAKIE